MTTTIVTLEPHNIVSSAQSLKQEFKKANLSGVITAAKGKALYVNIPISRLAEYRFSYTREHCSWRTSRSKVVIESKGFAVEQQTHDKVFSVVFRLAPAGSKPTVLEKTSPIRTAFFQRSLRAIKELQSLDEEKLAEAVQAPTDFSVLLSALNTEEALEGIRTHNPLATARLRGLEAKRKWIEAEGGTLSTAQVAKALSITRQAVDKRRREGKLLAVELGRKGFRYPAWQIGLPNLRKVLQALGNRDTWEQLAFFLNPIAMLEDRTPLDILREGRHDITDVLRAAAAYGEQGA